MLSFTFVSNESIVVNEGGKERIETSDALYPRGEGNAL